LLLSGQNSKKKVAIRPEGFMVYQLQHPLESYLYYNGSKFPARFDANTYLRLLFAFQDFDLRKGNGSLKRAFSSVNAKVMISSISSDVCFYPSEQAEIAEALKFNGVEIYLHKVKSDKGHDSFLIEPEKYESAIKEFLEK
jgi:homoserine O-acetyltransferase